MCGACGRPQPAGRPRCIACEAVLPEAPLPGGPAPGEPFFVADLGGGRMLSGQGTRLFYQPHPSVMVPPVELDSLREARLESRYFREALALTVFALLGLWAQPVALKVLGLGMAALGGLLALTCRSHGLVLVPRQGAQVRWPLGLARRGSPRDTAVGGVDVVVGGPAGARRGCRRRVVTAAASTDTRRWPSVLTGRSGRVGCRACRDPALSDPGVFALAWWWECG